MRVVLLGAGGQLAHDLAQALSDWDLHPFTRTQLDITDHAAVRQQLTALVPDLVINTAAFLDVEAAETEPDAAHRVNAAAAGHLAAVCEQLNAKLVCFSTDYVFDGAKRSPYLESDPPRPLNVYGASKLAGERLIEASCRRFLIVRTSGLYGLAGSRAKRGNFVETMIRQAAAGDELRVVADQVLAPTCTADLAMALVPLLEAELEGLVHLACAGQCSWAEFGQAVLDALGLPQTITPITSAEFPGRARRPAYSVLASGRPEVRELAPLPAWRDSLHAYLAARRESGGQAEERT